jgi:hypothetical protein
MTSLIIGHADELHLQAFTYKPLTTADSIRLLLLQPGPPGHDLHCRLIHTTLVECYNDIYDQYTALSYVWGDPKELKTIFIDDQLWSITVNLATALDVLRDERKVLRLWADAICIDQSNTQERNHQVGLMREIYTLAKQTVVFLGDSNKHCERVLNGLIYSKMNNELRQLAVTQILSRPWFTRVWIYQELVLSKEVWVQCGRIRVKWDRFCSALLGARCLMNYDHLQFQKLGQGMDLLLNMQKARQKFRLSMQIDSEPESLLSILLARRGFGVTDLRDLIYGHLAVAGLHQHQYGFEVDYGKSVIEVFRDATCHIIETEGWRVLLHVELSEAERRLKDLPSWVPDWSLGSSYSMAHLPPLFDLSSSKSHKHARYRARDILSPARDKKLAEIQDTSSVISAPSDPNIEQQIKELVEFKTDSVSLVHPVAMMTNLCQSIYNYWIEQHIGSTDNFGPDSTKANFFRVSEAHEIVSVAFDIDFKSRRRLSERKPKTLTHYLVDHFLKRQASSIITGRKIASISPGTLAIVPAEARRGDALYCLPIGDHIHFVVLRPYSRTTYRTEPDHMTLHLFATSRVEYADKIKYFTLIGTAWIEPGPELFFKKTDPYCEFDGYNISLC